MDEREFLTAVAKNLHWGYTKYWTGDAGKWRDVTPEERKLWLRLARRTVTKLDELREAAASSADDDIQPEG